MKTITNRISFTASCFKQAWWEGLAAAAMKAQDLAIQLTTTKKGRLATAGTGIALYGLRTGTASAAGGTSACPTGGATSSIVKLFQNIGMLLYVIGGIFALVCFAGAALMFMASGNNPARADKGMKWAKNTVIGLAFLAGGYFFRSIVVDFVGNSGAAATSSSTDPNNAGLKDCTISQTQTP